MNEDEAEITNGFSAHLRIERSDKYPKVVVWATASAELNEEGIQKVTDAIVNGMNELLKKAEERSLLVL